MLSRFVAGLALALLPLSSGMAQTATPPTPEQFAAAQTFRSAALSPSGRYLAGIAQRGTLDALVVIDLTTRASNVIQRADETKRIQMGWVAWKTDETILLGALMQVEITERRATGTHVGTSRTTEEYWIPRVISMARTGGPVTMMFEDQSNRLAVGYAPTTLVDRLARDPDHVLLSAYGQTGMALWRANVSTGRVTKLAEGSWNTSGFFVDSTGAAVLRADRLPRNSGYRFWRRAPGAEDWIQFLELKRAEAANSTVFTPLAAASAPGKIYVAARPEGQDRAAIYAFDAATGEYGPPLLTHPTADLDMPVIDEVNHDLLGACADVQRIECVGSDPVVARHLRAIDAFFGRAAHFVVDEMSHDRMTWLLKVEEPASTMAYYIYKRDAASITPVITTRDALASATFGATTIVNYKSRDGADLWGYLTNPPAAGGPPKALVVMPHGGPEARDSSGFDDWAQFLATRGYAVFQPNFRGGAGFGRAFVEAGYRQWGQRMQHDITDGVKHLVSAGTVDPARVCIFGWSYGGYAALAGGALTPELYKCVIAGAGPSDLLDMLASERVEEGRGSAAYSYWVRAIGDPSTDRDALNAVSPRRLAASFRAPVLLLHGAEDDVVPPVQSRQMNEALRRAGKDVRYVEIKEEGHHLIEYESRVLLYKELDAFLGRHLPAN